MPLRPMNVSDTHVIAKAIMKLPVPSATRTLAPQAFMMTLTKNMPPPDPSVPAAAPMRPMKMHEMIVRRRRFA